MDPDTFQPTLSFLYLKDLPSQDTNGIVKAIESAFSIHDLHHLLQKMVFIASDGASTNSGLKGGIAAKFREEEELSWLSFTWCLLHQLELAISDSLHEHLLSVKQCLHNLFYLYEKSSKKLRELCLLHKILKNNCEFENEQVKPAKPTEHGGSLMWYEA